jgi:chorismate mutase
VVAGAPGADHWRRLQQLRAEIDSLDLQLIEMLATRFQLVHEITAHKQQLGLPFRCPPREQELRAAARKLALQVGLDACMAEHFYDLLFTYKIHNRRQKTPDYCTPPG